MTNETALHENHFKEHLNKSRDVIINHIRKIHPNSKIQVMTNKSDILQRRKHFGAHIYVDGHYYYITFSRKDEFCEHYFSINASLLELLKHCNEDWHLLLISNGKVHTFDAKAIVDNAKLFNETTYKVSLSVESSNVDADFRRNYNEESEYAIDFTYLGNVRYNKKFDMHKKRIYIELNGKRVEYGSVESAWAELSFHIKDKNGKWQKGKGKDANDVPAYRKSFTSFKNDLRNKSIEIYVTETKALRANIDYVAENSATACKAVRSLLVENIDSTNSDQTDSVCDSCNNGNVGGQRRLDKELDIIADKLVENETVKYTPAEIQRTVISFGSNENMLSAYTLGLTDKGLYKEAAYAAKVFNALNNIDFD